MIRHILQALEPDPRIVARLRLLQVVAIASFGTACAGLIIAAVLLFARMLP